LRHCDAVAVPIVLLVLLSEVGSSRDGAHGETR
jgi:hypothetical protein